MNKITSQIILISWLLITSINSGLIGADTDARLEMANSWWRGKAEVSPPAETFNKNFKPKNADANLLTSIGVPGRDGKRYIPYDLGQSMLMLPADWIGNQLHHFFPKISNKDLRGLTVNFLMFIPLNVAAVVACFWLLKELGFTEKLAGLSSIVWLISTSTLHYCQVIQQNNQILLFSILGYALILKSMRNEASPWFIFLSGLGLGFSVIIRITSIFHALTTFLFLVACLIYDKHRRQGKNNILKSAIIFVLGLLCFVLLGRYLDFWRYGSFGESAATVAANYMRTDLLFSHLSIPDNYPAIYSPSVGILGVLFSPAKSIFIYDPLLIPGMILVFMLRKKLSPYIIIYIITATLNLAFFTVLTSKLEFWHADAAWGARYQVTSVDLLLIPLVAILLQHLFSVRGWRSWIIKSLLTLAIVTQILSVTLLFGVEPAQGEFLPLESRYLQFRLGQRVSNIICQIKAAQLGKTFTDLCVSDTYQQLQRRPVVKSFLDRQQVAFLPFNYARFSFNRKHIFLLWILLLFSGVILLVRFYCLTASTLKIPS